MTARHAVVTGGSSGIGAAVVERLIERGLMVSVFDLTRPEDPRDDVRYFEVDVTDRDAVQTSTAEAAARGIDPDALVTSHGIRGAFAPALDLDPDRVR